LIEREENSSRKGNEGSSETTKKSELEAVRETPGSSPATKSKEKKFPY